MGHPSPAVTNTFSGYDSRDTAGYGQRQAIRQAGYDWANTPYSQTNPWLQQAAGGFQGASNAGNLGLSALSGDQNAYQQLANPFQQNVLDTLQNRWGQLAQNTTNQVNSAATGAGAFGGTRQGVAQGVALSQLNQDQASQIANLLNSNYANTMNQAGNLANLGMGANQALGGLGQYANEQANNAAANRFRALATTYGAVPGGTETTTIGSPGSASPGGKAAGSVLQLAPLIAGLG